MYLHISHADSNIVFYNLQYLIQAMTNDYIFPN